ncbi:GT13, partial [Symbiodinium sp. KB8]
HLFFATGGPPNLPMDVQAQPLQVRSLAILEEEEGDAEGELHPPPWLLDSFKAASEGNLTLALPGPIRIVGFNRKMTATGTPTDETTPRELLKLLSRSRFCVVPPADTSSIGKRFYDAVLAECIPVVIAFPTKYGLGKSWWTFDGTPVEWSLPFAHQGLDYSKLAIEIPVEEVRQGNAVAYLAAISEAVAARRLAYLRAVRNHLIFDYSGDTIDAFSVAAAPVTCLDLPRLDDTPWSIEEKGWIDGVNRQAWGVVECYFVAGRLPVGWGPGFRNLLPSSPAVSE